MELVTEITKPKFINPRTLLIYSKPKCGKTAISSGLKNHLILELEVGGAGYIEGRIQEINKASEFIEVLTTIRNSPEQVCEYLIVDTVTKMDEWSEIVGTYYYMDKAQGQKFNRDARGNKLTHVDKRFESVHEIGNGFGYQHSRNVMLEWYDMLNDLISTKKVKYLILLAHIKDKLIESKSGDTVEAIDINLTGKVKSIYASRVDAIGYFYRKEKDGFLSFDNDYKVISGGRCSHLNGEIKISEKQEDGSIKTFWEKIYKQE